MGIILRHSSKNSTQNTHSRYLKINSIIFCPRTKAVSSIKIWFNRPHFIFQPSAEAATWWLRRSLNISQGRSRRQAYWTSSCSIPRARYPSTRTMIPMCVPIWRQSWIIWWRRGSRTTSTLWRDRTICRHMLSVPFSEWALPSRLQTGDLTWEHGRESISASSETMEDPGRS